MDVSILRATTRCGANHVIKSKVFDLQGNLIQYEGSIETKKRGTVDATWKLDGTLCLIDDEEPNDNIARKFSLINREEL